MAQLAERSLPTPEDRGSNPVISNFIKTTFIYCIKKTKIKKNRQCLANIQLYKEALFITTLNLSTRDVLILTKRPAPSSGSIPSNDTYVEDETL